MRPQRNITITCSLATLVALVGCGGSDSSNAEAVAPDYQPDTSYLDGLAEDQGVETSEPEDQPIEIDQTSIGDPEKSYEDEDREWIEEEGARSVFGRSRDRARETRDSITGGTDPERGIANTTYDEEYAQAAGFAWDMPEGWRMAVPGTGNFAEMYIHNPLGNASVVFSRTTENTTQTRRTLESNITDTFGSTKTRTSTKAVMGHTVTIFDLEGTYIDPSGKGSRNENPFYAIRAALVELPTTRVLIKMWGPQDTVNQNKSKFDAMIEKMYEK